MLFLRPGIRHPFGIGRSLTAPSLQTPPHDDALAPILAFGSSFTWLGDFHPDSPVPCLARTFGFRRAPPAARRTASRCSVARALDYRLVGTASPLSRVARSSVRSSPHSASKAASVRSFFQRLPTLPRNFASSSTLFIGRSAKPGA